MMIRLSKKSIFYVHRLILLILQWDSANLNWNKHWKNFMNNISTPTGFSWSGHWCAMFSSLNKSLIAFSWRFYQMKVRNRVNFLTRFAVPSLISFSKMEHKKMLSAENLFERMCLGTFKVLERWEGFVCQCECLTNRSS